MSRVGTVDRYVSRIGEEISGGKASGSAAVLVRDIVGLFSENIPGIKRGLDRYRQRIWVSGMPDPEIDDLHDLKLLKEKLLMFRDELIGDAPDTPSSGGGTGPLNIYLDNSATQTVSADSHATASANATVTISQAIDAVDADPELSVEQKTELQSLLAQAKGAAAAGDKGLFARIGSKIMEGVEKATPPLIVKVLEFLVSQAVGL